MMAQDPESNSFDSTNPRLKGLQRVLRPTERRSQGHPGALQSREESWSPRSVFRGKAMCLPQLSLTIMGFITQTAMTTHWRVLPSQGEI